MLFLLFGWFLSLLIGFGDANQCVRELSIETLLSKTKIPGAIILVFNRNSTLYELNYGYDSLSPVRSMETNRSIFTLASISKTFISIAVMKLVELNRLELDRDINEYLNSSNERIFHPRYPTSKITLRQLLSHSASINRNDQMEGDFVELADQALDSIGLADTCYRYLRVNASNWLPEPPGTVTLYSNIGSALAALVVERVTNTVAPKVIHTAVIFSLCELV